MKGTLAEKKVNLSIFLPPIILLGLMVVAGTIWPDALGTFMTNLLFFMTDHFGWYINLLSLGLVFLSLLFIIGRYGDVKIGGKDAKPEYTMFQWISMTICGGIGTGLVPGGGMDAAGLLLAGDLFKDFGLDADGHRGAQGQGDAVRGAAVHADEA